ncbi:Blue copper protein [Glycine soja]|nr:Blue copper protein [Glycine soja]
MAFNVTSSYTIRRTRRKNQQKRSSPRIQQGRPHLQEHIAMSRNLLLVLFAVATFLHGSEAQTRHVVGDATGWIIPPGGAATYTTWASNKTFTVGDTLGNAVLTLTSGPATVTLNETGEQYYICSFGSHCSGGQKLAINVNRASSSTPSPAPEAQAPAPKATSPISPPRSTPAPGPSSGSVTYTVGETAGWIVPGNASFYPAWASAKNFKVGDILVFNYPSNAHNVEEVTKANYDSCSSASPIATFTTPPARVPLSKSGEHYYICGIPGHCLGGQSTPPPPPLLLALLHQVLSVLPHRTLLLHLSVLLEYPPPFFQLPRLFSIILFIRILRSLIYL